MAAIRPRSVRRPFEGAAGSSSWIFSGRIVKRAPSRSSRLRDADEADDELVGRLLVQLDRRADLLDAALVEDRDPVAHRQRLVLVVGDVDEGDAHLALDRLQLDLHLLAQLQVEGAERLVEQQHPGAVDDRAGERDALALAAGELSRPAVAVAGKADHLECLVASPGALGPGDARDPQPVCDVLADGHVWEQGVVLKDRVDRPVVGRHAAHVLPGQLDRSPARLLEAGDHPQRRRLAGARGPKQREELALLDLQVDARDRTHLAVTLGEVGQADVGWSSYTREVIRVGA